MVENKASRQVTITNPQGLHARPADLFARMATQFDAEVELVKNNEHVDGKSILSILTLAAVQGTTLLIHARGPDAEAAVQALSELVRQGFPKPETSTQALKPEG